MGSWDSNSAPSTTNPPIMDIPQGLDITGARPDYDFNLVNTDLYMDPANASSSQSSGSPYQAAVPYFQDYIASDVYPSPEGDMASPVSESAYPLLVHASSEVKQEQLPISAVIGSTPPATSSSTSPSAVPAKGPAKRKRENRYKNAPPSVLSRRRAQNRASQRAYRERKDQRIKDLEQDLSKARLDNRALSLELQCIKDNYNRLRAQQNQMNRISSVPLSQDHLNAHTMQQNMSPNAMMSQDPNSIQAQATTQMAMLPHHPPLQAHHRHSSSAASHMSHLSQLSAASSVSTTAVSPMTMPQAIAPPMMAGFDHSAAAATMVLTGHAEDINYLYGQMAPAYPHPTFET